MSTSIHYEIIFKASQKQVYDALMDANQFSTVTGGAPTEIKAEAGGAFSLFGGMITGRNIELLPNERIVQAWRAGNWAEGVYSIAKFELKKQGEETLVIFDHVGFPDGQGEHLAGGWKDNYWVPIEKYLS
ncbi:SRPBCC domain-containing protein [Neobacillus cucumis]|jgi:activator of HSP90 ATPase|uniref:SRPBCC domain-containing protein n=1 Tax=Neobacillus cucumis TaxID=1740721 RepID=UPI002E2340A3|nr:SRPBCC domain-containing protein [Neobacillus cucumis]